MPCTSCAPCDAMRSAAPKRSNPSIPFPFFGCTGEGPHKVDACIGPRQPISWRGSVLQQVFDKHPTHFAPLRVPPNLVRGAGIYGTTMLSHHAGAAASGDLPFASPCAEQRDMVHRTGSWRFVTSCGPELFAKQRQRDVQAAPSLK